jgi:hypothetical protein
MLGKGNEGRKPGPVGIDAKIATERSILFC